MKVKTFEEWLRDEYGNRNHRYKYFFEDAIRDGGFPWDQLFNKQAAYLLSKRACRECLETHKDAYREWLNYRFARKSVNRTRRADAQ